MMRTTRVWCAALSKIETYELSKVNMMLLLLKRFGLVQLFSVETSNDPSARQPVSVMAVMDNRDPSRKNLLLEIMLFSMVTDLAPELMCGICLPMSLR